MTRLPASEKAFELCQPQETPTLDEALGPRCAELSEFSVAIILAALFGCNLMHLHRPGVDDCEDDLNGEFWQRHGKLDNILLIISLTLPSRLRVPMGLPNPNV